MTHSNVGPPIGPPRPYFDNDTFQPSNMKHVNQAYLLKQLSLDQKAMLALMKNNSYTDESLEEYHKASFQIIRSVSDWLSIFSLIG